MRVLMLVSTLILSGAAVVPDVDRGDRVDRSLGGDYFSAGQSLIFENPIAGDLIAAGRDIDVKANVGGDAVIAGRNVRVPGNITQDIYAAGDSLWLNGAIARNARIAGRTVEVTPNSTIEGNASVAAGDVRIDGNVNGYIQAVGRHVYINGPVGGDVEATANQVELGPNARIAGKLRYTSEKEIIRDPAAQVMGPVEYIQRTDLWGRSYRGLMLLLWTAGLILVAIVAAAILPNAYARVTSTLETRPGLSLLLGIAATFFIPIAAFILILSFIGIPLGLLAMAIYLALLLLGYVTAGTTLGDFVLRRWKPDLSRTSWRIAAAVLGVLLLGLAGFIPVVGSLVMFAALLFGVGAVVLQVRPPSLGRV